MHFGTKHFTNYVTTFNSTRLSVFEQNVFSAVVEKTIDFFRYLDTLVEFTPDP